MTPKDTIYNGADEKTRAFSAKLIPTKKAIIGLKTPFVESVAKDIAAGKYGDVRIVVGSLSDDVYEELLIKSFVVAKLKTDDETKRADVRNIVAAIDNWANCDMFVARCKFIGKDREKWFDYLTEYLESDKEYDLRFAIVAMMTYYLTDEYIDRVLALSSNVISDKYYVKMAVAWLMATALCKFPDKALDVIKSNVLDVWTHNKALQKARESFRIEVAKGLSQHSQTKIIKKGIKKPPGFFPRWLFF